MANSESDTKTNWEQRSVQWVNAAPETVSKNDAPNQALIEAAGIQPGDQVLDLASGTGEPSISIALLVGERGSVTATDATANMLAAAEARAARLKLGNMRFRVTPMEEIPFADQSFDAVTCRFGLMHADQVLAGLGHARRVLKPGKKAAFMVHGPAEGNNLWATVHRAAAVYFGIDNRAAFANHFRYSGQGELSALLREAGFQGAAEKEISAIEVKDKGSNFWKATLQRGYAERVEKLSAAEMLSLDETMRAAFAEFLGDQGYRLMSSQRIGWGWG